MTARRRPTARERFETRALEQSAIMEGALDAIVTMDRRGIVTSFNRAAEVTFGYTRAEAVGRPLVDLIVPEALRERHRTGLARYITTGESRILGRRQELPATRKDGSEFMCELSIIATRANDVVTFTGFIRDITDRRLAEEARVHAVQLQEENRRVHEASRLKSEFLANMSHELRTPLNSIIGFAELLHDGRLGPIAENQREFLNDILVSAQHLLELINGVLDLATIEAGRTEFVPEPVDLGVFTNEMRSQLEPLAFQKRIKLSVEVDPTLTGVVTDVKQLKQVLYNFLSNALKFTAEGGRVITRVLGESGDRFRIEVEDTGIGIRAEDLGRLFVEFHQLDGSAAKRHQGTGLGLALTRRLVEAQGGTVGVTSTFGAGSVFWATLPRMPLTGSSRGILSVETL